MNFTVLNCSCEDMYTYIYIYIYIYIVYSGKGIKSLFKITSRNDNLTIEGKVFLRLTTL
jgi:hypothetical protein